MILVTGASGLLGGNIVSMALQSGQQVAAVSHRHKLSHPDLASFSVDLTRSRDIEQLLDQVRPQWIIHCAALTHVDGCEDNPARAYAVNEQMSRDLAVGARMLGAGMVYISTDSVFDGETGDYTENDAVSPVNIYAKTKLAGERAVAATLGRSLIIRTNIYGWNVQQKMSLAEWALSRLEQGEHIPGFRDVYFTPILANDLTELLFAMIAKQLTGLYHVVGSEVCSKYEFARCIASVFGLPTRLVQASSIEAAALRAPRPRNTTLKTDKIAQALGRTLPDVRAGLERFKTLRDTGYLTALKKLNSH